MMRFSVIIPVYNAAETLTDCLESLQKQTLTDFEVIAVNDGGTDNSLEMLKDFEKDFENATILTQENKGLGNARNEAAKIAMGSWLVFLDADDTWQVGKLQLIAQEITNNPKVDLIYHPVFEKYLDGRMRKRAFTPISNLQEFIELGNPFVPSAMAIKSSVFKRFGGFIEDRNQVEDLLLWMKLLHNGINVHPLNKPLTVYRVGSGVTASLEDHLQKVEHAMQQAFNEKLVSKVQVEQFINRKNYEAARQFQKLGDHQKAKVYYKKLGDASLKKRILSAANNMGLAI